MKAQGMSLLESLRKIDFMLKQICHTLSATNAAEADRAGFRPGCADCWYYLFWDSKVLWLKRLLLVSSLPEYVLANANAGIYINSIY